MYFSLLFKKVMKKKNYSRSYLFSAGVGPNAAWRRKKSDKKMTGLYKQYVSKIPGK